MIDIYALPVLLPDLYVTHSRLADAGIPMGATITHIFFPRVWRRVDALRGEGHSRRWRIRARRKQREPFVYVPNIVEHKLTSGHGYVPPSHRGYSA